ncbi:MAG: ribonuclease P protein component [Mollicutes bacterium PWAP]|nr:ribonuclease P protein component [Mollicutes bacterium PWAP]
MKKNILRKNHEFQKVLKGKQIVNRDFVIYYSKAKTQNYRIGISVSKKITNSVGRNSQRRKMRASFSKIIFPKYDYVIIVRKHGLSLSIWDTIKEINFLINKI